MPQELVDRIAHLTATLQERGGGTMNRYKHTDNFVEEILEDLHDGLKHDGSWTKKLFARPLILLTSIIAASLVAIMLGYGSAQLVVACMRHMPTVSSLPLVLALPIALFAVGTPIHVAIVSFSIVRQQTYMMLRRQSGDSCDDRVIIPVRILNHLLV